MNDPEDALMAALAEHGGGHGYRAAAREALSLLNQRGWSLVQADPFDLSARNALVAVLDGIELTTQEHSCGEECWEGLVPRSPAYVADELIDALTTAGWSLVRPDPFAAAKPPSGCCGGSVGPDGQRSMCCPVVTDMFAPGPSDEELAGRLDIFQEAAGRYALDRAGGTSREELDAYQAMINARTALVRLIVRKRAGSTNAPAIGGADAEPVIHREMRIGALAERLTALEDKLATWIPQEQA